MGRRRFLPATLSVAPVGRVPFRRRGGLPFPGQPCRLFHLFGNRAGPAAVPQQAGHLRGGPELIVRRLLFRQRLCVGQMPPRKERAALHGYALVVVYDFVRGVARRLGELSTPI